MGELRLLVFQQLNGSTNNKKLTQQLKQGHVVFYQTTCIYNSMFLLCLLQFQNILIANSEKTLLLYFLSFNHSKQYIKKLHLVRKRKQAIQTGQRRWCPVLLLSGEQNIFSPPIGVDWIDNTPTHGGCNSANNWQYLGFFVTVSLITTTSVTSPNDEK